MTNAVNYEGKAESSLGIFYGLLMAVSFGTADFLVTRSTRKVGPLRALYLIQIVGLSALLLTAIARGESLPGWSNIWIHAISLSIAGFSGMFFLYRAFAIGTLSLVSPISASYAVVTGLLALAFGERPPGLVLIGAGVLIIGVVIVARGSGGGSAGLAGVPDAIVAALFLGLFFWGMGDVANEWGWLWPVLVNRCVQFVCALVLLRRGGESLSIRPELGNGKLLAGAALFDTAALLSFNLGVAESFTTTTTALGSLYSAVAVVLGWIFLKERLSPPQWAGIATILAGVLLVSV